MVTSKAQAVKTNTLSVATVAPKMTIFKKLIMWLDFNICTNKQRLIS